MSSVLIAGHGYLGSAAAKLFETAHWGVEGWTRGAQAAATDTIRAVDISDRTQVSRAAGDFDVVIHCASTRGGDLGAYRSVYFDGARNLIERFGQSIIVLTGSTSVYAERNGGWVTEGSPAQPDHARGKILREAEQAILESGGIVTRLSGICGPDRSYLLQKFLSGEATIDPASDRYINQVHRDDAASALFLLAKKGSGVAGQIFNVTDDEPLLQSECYRWLAQKLGRPVPPCGPSASSNKRGGSHKRVSNSRLRGLGWSPAFPTFAEAMSKSILPSFGL